MIKILDAYRLNIGKSVTRIMIGFLTSSIIGLFVYINSTLEPEINVKLEKLRNDIYEPNDSMINEYIYIDKETKIIHNLSERFENRQRVIAKYNKGQQKFDSINFYNEKLNSNNYQIIEDKGILLLI